MPAGYRLPAAPRFRPKAQQRVYHRLAEWNVVPVERDVRATYGAPLSPDATACAHVVDEGGHPRAVQRFPRGRRASSSRDVELPVEGPVARVVHSADGHWPAGQVAPGASTRSQIWVVTTDPDDRMARRIDGMDAGTAELIAWDGGRVYDVADRACHLTGVGIAAPERIACAGWPYGGYLTMAALTFHPDLYRTVAGGARRHRHQRAGR